MLVTVEKFPATVFVYEKRLSPAAARTLPSGLATAVNQCSYTQASAVPKMTTGSVFAVEIFVLEI